MQAREGAPQVQSAPTGDFARTYGDTARAYGSDPRVLDARREAYGIYGREGDSRWETSPVDPAFQNLPLDQATPYGGGAPTAANRGYAPQGAPRPTGNFVGGMVPTDTNINPPITDFEQIDGASLPPPGMANGNALAALSYFQSAPSSQLANSLWGEVFSQRDRKPLTANFDQLQRVFGS